MGIVSWYPHLLYYYSDDYRSDIDNDHDFVADIDSDTLIRIVKFLKRGKAPGPDNIHTLEKKTQIPLNRKIMFLLWNFTGRLKEFKIPLKCH